MKNNYVITIGREYGSGGHEIGLRLARELGLAFYDKELIAEASKLSGMRPEMFEKLDERCPTGLERYLSLNFSDGGLSQELIFQHQSQAIEAIAIQHSAVIVGRCADYVLRDYQNIIRIFVHADNPWRIKQIANKEKIAEERAAELLSTIDRRREAYYNYYTSKKWGNVKSYDITLNSSVLGIDGCVEVLKAFAERWRMNPE